MNPVPLKSPNGTVYAWACERCDRVGRCWDVALRTNVADRAESSRGIAEKCCLCETCKAIVEQRGTRTCNACFTEAMAEAQRVASDPDCDTGEVPA